MALLQVKSCAIRFGGLQALNHFSFDLDTKEIAAIIGPNGAGKTTFFNLLTGVYEPTEGSLLFDGQALTGRKPYQISRLGIARTFQNIRLFGDLTVVDNVLVAFHCHLESPLMASFTRGKKFLHEERSRLESACDLLKIFGLFELRSEKASSLSHGDQRRLEIVRALATQPRLLLLDEPAAGMNATEKNHLIELIRKIHRDYRLSILLIEHDMSVVMNLCPRILVLDYGEMIAEGTPEEIRKNPKVIEAYLGTEKKNVRN